MLVIPKISRSQDLHVAYYYTQHVMGRIHHVSTVQCSSLLYYILLPYTAYSGDTVVVCCVRTTSTPPSIHVVVVR